MRLILMPTLQCVYSIHIDMRFCLFTCILADPMETSRLIGAATASPCTPERKKGKRILKLLFTVANDSYALLVGEFFCDVTDFLQASN